MPILIMCAATMQALQDEEIDLMEGLRPVAVVTLLFAVFALVPKQEDGVWRDVYKRQALPWAEQAHKRAAQRQNAAGAQRKRRERKRFFFIAASSFENNEKRVIAVPVQ